MILVDKDIAKLLDQKRLIIQSIEPDFPFDPSKHIEAGSIELRLGNHIRRYRREVECIDLIYNVLSWAIRGLNPSGCKPIERFVSFCKRLLAFRYLFVRKKRYFISRYHLLSAFIIVIINPVKNSVKIFQPVSQRETPYKQLRDILAGR